MAKKIVYVLPGDLIEVRVCDPIFGEGANAGAWKQSINPSSYLLHAIGFDRISVLTPFLSVYKGVEPHRKQML